jgi:signal transduction histidine kinase
MLILTHNATRPIEEVADAAARVADGDLSVSVPVERDDEIGRLASTFNRMTEKLRERQELEGRLANAEKRAEIGHLASGLAHEIKNPLNALSLGLDVLRRRHRPADEDSALAYSTRIESLREEINRLATLINNFLAFGRPLSLTLARVDLAALVVGTLADLGETAAQSRVEIVSEIDHELPRVQADGSLLKSAVWNLIQNGIQAMERTGGTLSVTLRKEDAGDDRPPRVTLTISDSGPGIAPEDLPHLFEPYFSRKEGGLGLGLAMVKRIVQEHGGRVEAENRQPEPGALFRLSLPIPLTGGTLPA